MEKISVSELFSKIEELESRLEESEQLIDAIKAGEVDAFAINKENKKEVYTLQSGDYAYRVLIEEMGQGAINVTEEGLIVYINPCFFNLLKVPYEKVIGSSVFDFIHPDSQKEFNRLFKKSLKGKSQGEINLAFNNTIVPVLISLTSLQPKLATVGIIITDFTEKKKNEKLILEYQNNLENKNQKLIQSNEELASFAYIASHDLQEPLRKIRTFANRILEQELNGLSETGKDYFNRMDIAAKRMQTLIEDLLTYSRTNSIERAFEHINLNKIIEDVKVELREEIQKKKAVIEASKMCEANIIPFQFRQLLLNLISNSLKFSNPGQAPYIKIKSEIVKGKKFKHPKLSPEIEYCHISISDKGIGFEQQYSARIFEVFQRLHDRGEYEGTGIGLSIVKKIVENHNGFITASAEINKGATFDIYIPAN